MQEKSTANLRNSPEELIRLARTSIITNGKRAGDEPGINQWTGEKTGKEPIRGAQVINEEDPADGILHKGRYPGTHNIDADNVESAWHERAAVHRALEDLSGHKDWSARDVNAHVTLLRRMAEKNLLGPEGERYVSASKALPSLVGRSWSVKGTGPGSRPQGPRMDALTALVRPLVERANGVLARGEKSRSITAPPPDNYESPEDPRDVPDRYPEPKKADPAKIKGAGARDVAKIKKEAGKEAAETDEAAAAANADEAPIPLALAPGETGATGHRWNTIRDMLKGGADRAGIVENLKKTFFLSHRRASDTLRRFLRAETARRGLEREAATEEPTKLAKPKDTGKTSNALPAPVLRSELNGKVGSPVEYKGGFGKSALPTPAFGVRENPRAVDPHHADTSFAYHMRALAKEFRGTKNDDIASLAEHLLTNPLDTANPDFLVGTRPKTLDAGREGPRRAPAGVNANGDKYLALGKRLKAVKHRLASAYNWDTMGASIRRDKWAEKTLASLFAKSRPEGMSDVQFYDSVLKNYAEPGKNKDHDRLWAKLHAHARSSGEALSPGRDAVTGKPLFDPEMPDEARRRLILDSIERLQDKALDREYLKTAFRKKIGGGATPEEEAAEKKAREDMHDTSVLNWRTVMGRTPDKAPLRFSRAWE